MLSQLSIQHEHISWALCQLLGVLRLSGVDKKVKTCVLTIYLYDQTAL
mgnify:CR=1 FL=1